MESWLREIYVQPTCYSCPLFNKLTLKTYHRPNSELYLFSTQITCFNSSHSLLYGWHSTPSELYLPLKDTTQPILSCMLLHKSNS